MAVDIYLKVDTLDPSNVVTYLRPGISLIQVPLLSFTSLHLSIYQPIYQGSSSHRKCLSTHLKKKRLLVSLRRSPRTHRQQVNQQPVNMVG